MKRGASDKSGHDRGCYHLATDPALQAFEHPTAFARVLKSTQRDDFARSNWVECDAVSGKRSARFSSRLRKFLNSGARELYLIRI